jgi:hypothetical protein
VYAKVTAANVYGSSDDSLPGSGAVVYVVPDAPL